MPLKRENFTVYLNGTDDGDPTEQLTQITHQDMLRGEAELVRSGAADNARLALVACPLPDRHHRRVARLVDETSRHHGGHRPRRAGRHR
jgi:hypothetical protein